MIEIEVLDKNKRAYLPENLGECDTQQYIAMSRFIYLFQNGQITEPQFYQLAIYKLLDIKPSNRIADGSTTNKRYENIAWLSQFVLNFFDNDSGQLKIKLDFTHNPIPKFKHNLLTFTGPKDEFENINFGQYLEGLGYFLDYEQFHEYQTLVKLLAVFYRNQNPFIPKSLKKLDRIDPGILYGFYLFFASFHKYISTGTIFYNGIEIDLSIIFQADEDTSLPKSNLPGLGMKSILFDIAASGVFGNKSEVEKTNFWEIILRLYDLRKKAKDEKKYYESLKNKK